MIGRFTQLSAWAEIAKSYCLGDGAAAIDCQSRYNISLSQSCLIIRKERDGARRATIYEWGLVLFFAARKPVNRLTVAPASSVLENPNFREAFGVRRCLVPCSGFFTWRTVQWAAKQPYLVSMRDNSPFAMAGIWERWVDPRSGSSLLTFAILITEANDLVAPLDKQMPVILESQNWGPWLSGSPAEVRRLLKPYPSEKMSAFRVSAKVNDKKNNDPEVLRPLG